MNTKEVFVFNKGFSLIELMFVIVILGIILAIAIPSYQSYALRADASSAEQAVQDVAMGLNKHKTRNFNFRGFALTLDPMVLPVNSSGNNVKYAITVRDGANSSLKLTDAAALGQEWVIRAESKNPKNYTYLMVSTGFRCKSKTAANVTYSNCGTGADSEKW